MSHRPSQRVRSLEWPRLLNGGREVGGREVGVDEARHDYRGLRDKHCRRPDGSWIAELEMDANAQAELNKGRPGRGVEGQDEAHAHPLGDDDDNPWKQYYASTLPTLEQILLDLSRLQLDEEPASSQGGNSSSKHIPTLARILFVWSLTHHEAPGYKQGMHDVASALLIVRTRDSSHASLDAEHTEADTYLLFSLLTQHIAPLYYPTTIASYTDSVRSSLMQVDPALGSHLQRIDVEPRLFLLRWLRLLFLRELPMEDCLELWDGIFDATTKSLDVGTALQWVCVAALLRMRGKLLASGQSEALAMLMREWEVPPVGVTAADGTGSQSQSQHYASLLVQQAALLSSRPTPATGVQCAVQNQEVLGIPLRHAAPTSPDEDVDAAQAYPNAAAGSPFTSATLSRAAFAGAQKTAAWAYQNATIRMAAAAAAAAAGAYASPSSASDRAGFPSGWDLGEVEARRLRRGKAQQAQQQRQSQGGTGEAGLRSPPLDEGEHMVERDRKLALVLDGVLAKLQGKAGAGPAVADEEALAALVGVRDVLAGKKDIAALGLDGVEADAGEAGSKSASSSPADPLSSVPAAPRPPSGQQPPKSPPPASSTPTKPTASPPARNSSGHRAFARLPSPPTSKPTRSLVDDPLGALGGN